jgi:hypothetical protein
VDVASNQAQPMLGRGFQHVAGLPVNAVVGDQTCLRGWRGGRLLDFAGLGDT